MSGLLERIRRRLVRSPEEIEAEALQDRAEDLGVTPIAEIVDRTRVDCTGVVRSLVHPAASGTPHLSVELYDGSGSLMLVWLGRRVIRGIDPGVHLRVHGRAARRAGVVTMFNPRYEIIPSL